MGFVSSLKNIAASFTYQTNESYFNLIPTPKTSKLYLNPNALRSPGGSDMRLEGILY